MVMDIKSEIYINFIFSFTTIDDLWPIESATLKDSDIVEKQ